MIDCVVLFSVLAWRKAEGQRNRLWWLRDANRIDGAGEIRPGV